MSIHKCIEVKLIKIDVCVHLGVKHCLFLQALQQEKASLSTHYGAITGLSELGQEV